jgi:2-furoyl-CoA dehydrogenase large subunit
MQDGAVAAARSPGRVEDAALLMGQARFIDDLPVRRGTGHVAFFRAARPHAEIRAIDVSAAAAAPGVIAVLTGADVARRTRSLTVGLKADLECWPMAVDRVRYIGEPVALVVAESRYLAEDALDLIEVDYAPLPVVVDPRRALEPGAPVLHPGLGGNCISDRSFRYGDPEAAFARAPHRVEVEIAYPRNSCTPIETYGVIAEHRPGEDAYEITANFQGPFSIHAVVARALGVPGNRLRLRTPPESGGSFGIKQGIFPYMVLCAVASREAGRPVKWIEDRLEHLQASVSGTNRVTRLAAAIEEDGRILALDWDQIEDVGAHLRAPEPATLYRMHGNMTGAYAIRDVAIRNRVVLTNKTPTGLNRGFGGPQVFFALERLVQTIAVRLNLDPIEVIRRNLVPADAFPYRTAPGALLDSGDYGRALETALRDGGHAELLERREAARREGRIYGIGYAAIVEPSVSNMGYITTALTAEDRERAGPKNGAQSVATVSLDPLGSVTVKVASASQGQGHRTVLAEVVGEVLGLDPREIEASTDVDTARDPWSIASGNYSSRFAPAVAGAARLAAERVRAKLARIAAGQLNVSPDRLDFAEGVIRDRDNPGNALPFRRVAAASHWAPGTLPDDADQAISETVFWTPPELAAPAPNDEVNSSLCHGFIFDFCGIEIDPVSAAVRVDRYVTMHDCGRILHEAMVEGQIRGGFAQAFGAAFLEEYAYDAEGNFLTGSLADYLIPTVMEVPPLRILHQETPSPFTPLGAKGVGEGNNMSTPVCLANALADALGADIATLPILPSDILERTAPAERPPSGGTAAASAPESGGRALTGEGVAEVAASPEEIWALLLDPEMLRRIVPGAHDVRKVREGQYRADVTLGVGPVKGRYRAEIILSDMEEPEAVTLSGTTRGALGHGEGKGRVRLERIAGGTRIVYRYEARIGGKAASVGDRLLDGAARVVIRQFFHALGRRAAGDAAPAGPVRGLLARLWARLPFRGGAR